MELTHFENLMLKWTIIRRLDRIHIMLYDYMGMDYGFLLYTEKIKSHKEYIKIRNSYPI